MVVSQQTLRRRPPRTVTRTDPKLVKSAPRQASCMVVSQQTPRRRPPRGVVYRSQVGEECAKPGAVYGVVSADTM